MYSIAERLQSLQSRFARRTAAAATEDDRAGRATEDADRNVAVLEQRVKKLEAENAKLLKKLQDKIPDADKGVTGARSNPAADRADAAKSSARVADKVRRLARARGVTPGDLCRELNVDPRKLAISAGERISTGMARAAGLLRHKSTAIVVDDEGNEGLGICSPEEARAELKRLGGEFR